MLDLLKGLSATGQLLLNGFDCGRPDKWFWIFIPNLQKIANRITAGILLAALIIGAALLMRVQTNFVLLGYPGLAILCFLAAAAGGFWLVVSIFVLDHKGRKK